MNPTVFLVRHSVTEMNDPKNERVRGYSDIPISFEGKRLIENTKDFLDENKFPFSKILSSPLQRCMMSAQIIAGERAKVIPNPGLFPWHLGDIMGKNIKEVAHKMDYLQEFPDIEAPNGESYRHFYNRWADALERMLKFVELEFDEILVGVCHSRNLLALPSILEGRTIGNVPVKGGPPPASVTKISKGPDDKDWKIETIWGEKL